LTLSHRIDNFFTSPEIVRVQFEICPNRIDPETILDPQGFIKVIQGMPTKIPSLAETTFIASSEERQNRN
jgi:hypothetical protein